MSNRVLLARASAVAVVSTIVSWIDSSQAYRAGELQILFST